MKIGILILVTSLIVSCSGSPDLPISNSSLREINIDIKDRRVKIKDIIKAQNYKIFRGDNSFIIGEIDKIVLHDKHYYVLDKQQSGIIVFNESGSFDFLFSKEGYGPGEYNGINDFTIYKNMICVLDIDKIHMYSLTGEYIKRVRLTFTATKFENIENRFFSFFRHSNIVRAKNKNFNLIITNENGKILRKYFPYTKNDAKNNITTKNAFYVCNNEVNYIHRFNDTIYSLNSGYLKPKYYIAFGKDKIPQDPLKDDSYLNYPYFIKNFAENQNHLIFSFNYLKHVYNVVYDKRNKKSICYKTLSSDDSFLFKGKPPIIARGDGFCTVYEPFEYALFFNELKENQLYDYEEILCNYPNLETFFNYCESDLLNPILVFEEYSEF